MKDTRPLRVASDVHQRLKKLALEKGQKLQDYTDEVLRKLLKLEKTRKQSQ